MTLMNPSLADLIKVLQLERLEINLFRGESRDIGSPQVFGGQVLGQALRAAFGTIEGRMVHSLHAYFLRAGDYNAPIVYEVDSSRDGSSFSSRRVVAIQHGKQIFHMSASFQVEEQGLEHQIPMPKVTPPEELPLQKRYRGSTDGLRNVQGEFPFEFRMRPREQWSDEGRLYFWFRTVDALPEDQVLHRVLLAYVSDHYLIAAAIAQHVKGDAEVDMKVASLDHAMWFHRSVRIDEWLLYSLDSPSASGARGLARGSIFSRDGRLVASTAQEGLMRLNTPSKAPSGPVRPAGD
jgi:acyl-CoA thioesterase-2